MFVHHSIDCKVCPNRCSLSLRIAPGAITNGYCVALCFVMFVLEVNLKSLIVTSFSLTFK